LNDGLLGHHVDWSFTNIDSVWLHKFSLHRVSYMGKDQRTSGNP
jgi:hypothetical protein